MSEGQGPGGNKLFSATRRPDTWGRRLGLLALLTIGALCAVYFVCRWLGIENPGVLLTVGTLIVLGIQLIRRPGKMGGESSVLFTSPHRGTEAGSTDDMSIRMPPGWTAERLVDFVLAAKQRDAPYEEVVPSLVASGFTRDEALRGIDRSLGGLIRARFKSPRNEPSPTKDPIAWTSYHRGLQEPGLVAALFPSARVGAQARQPGRTELTSWELEVLRTPQGPENVASTPTNSSDDTLQLARVVVASRLAKMYGSWTVSGDKVEGPPGMVVSVAPDACSRDPYGLLLGFCLFRQKSEPIVTWDCTHGIGKTPKETLERAVDLWAQTTAATLLELSTQRGAFADHYHGAERGLAGWHVIQGPVLGYGRGEGPTLLRDWVGQHLLVPQLAGAFSAAKLPKDEPTGMKFFLGSFRGEGIAEVQVNHVIHDELSKALAALPWPRFDEPAYARTFVLFVHRE